MIELDCFSASDGSEDDFVNVIQSRWGVSKEEVDSVLYRIETLYASAQTPGSDKVKLRVIPRH